MKEKGFVVLPVLIVAALVAGGVIAGITRSGYSKDNSLSVSQGKQLVEVESIPSPFSTPTPGAIAADKPIPSAVSRQTSLPAVTPTKQPTPSALPIKTSVPTSTPTPLVFPSPTTTPTPAPSPTPYLGPLSCNVVAHNASGPAPLAVEFFYSAINLGSGHVTGVQWDFDGDGSWDTDFSYNRAPVHTYSSSGVYNAAMKVQLNTGVVTDNCYRDITVN